MKKALLLLLLLVSFGMNEAISQCGKISLIGEFNTWSDDYWMTQDPINQDIWTAVISLNNGMNNEGAADIIFIKFRADTAWTVNWGAESFPTGIGVQDGPNILVPIDTNAVSTDYFVTFNCSTGEYYFTSISVTAVRAYSMTIEGTLNEPEWDLNRTVSKLISGTLTGDPNVIQFGVAYDDNYLYVGLNVIDALPTIYEMGEVFIDGDKSGGPYDAHDLHLRFNGPVVTIVQGPPALATLIGFQLTAAGYSAELGIPLADFGILPTPELQIGFDIIFGDGDSGTGVDYMMSWAGGLENYEVTSSFGTLNFVDFTGLDEFEDYSSLVMLFPNPSKSNVYLNLANNVFNGNVNADVTDMAGRVVQNNRLNFHDTGGQIQLNVDQLSTGIYFVNIYDDFGSRAVKKLIVR